MAIEAGRAARMAAAALTLFGCTHARAEGAVALGVPNNVMESGFSYGYRVNADTPGMAGTDALAECRKSPHQVPRDACFLVSTFHDECVAVAMDPQDHTPGYGYAIASTLALSKQRALEFCRATAGNDRREACVVADAACDGSAK